MESLLTKITNKELQTYSVKIKSILEKYNLSDTLKSELSFVFTPFSNEVDKYEKSFQLKELELSSEEKSKLDEIRDKAFIGIKGLVTTFQNSTSQEKVEVAEKIEKVIREHGWNLDKDPYTVQTAGMRNLISDLEDKFTTEELKKIYVDGWVVDLKKAQQEYEDYTIKFNNSRANKGESPSELKKGLIKVMNEFINFLPFFQKMKNDNNITAIIDDINKLTIDTNTIIKSRETRSNNKKEELK